MCPSLSIMNNIGMIIALYRVSEDTTPLSHIYGQPPYQQPASYTPHQDQHIEEKSELEKSLDAFLESGGQIQNMKHS